MDEWEGHPVRRVQHEKRRSGVMPAFISFIEGNELTEEQQEKSRAVLSMEAKEKEVPKRRMFL